MGSRPGTRSVASREAEKIVQRDVLAVFFPRFIRFGETFVAVKDIKQIRFCGDVCVIERSDLQHSIRIVGEPAKRFWNLLVCCDEVLDLSDVDDAVAQANASALSSLKAVMTAARNHLVT